MRTKKETLERQQQFCKSYPFPEDYPPKMRAWDSAVNASVRRGYPVYSNRNADMHREAVAFWKIQLERLGEKYKKKEQNRCQFLKDVFELQDTINKSEYRGCFVGNAIRVGQCQKSLAIFLKWMWCQRELASIPPVCPIDRQVLNKCYEVLKQTGTMTEQDRMDCRASWSNLIDRDQYERLVKITERVAILEGESSTAIWELFAFQEPTR